MQDRLRREASITPHANGSQPWIEIFVDNVLRGWEKGWWLKLGFLREGQIGDVLFHEIGHHIHYTVSPEYREKEDVADRLEGELLDTELP